MAVIDIYMTFNEDFVSALQRLACVYRNSVI